jgi:hypothetical protein
VLFRSKFAWKENIALVEWTLEARGGKTLLRLVQSGFLGNEDWENEWFESTDYGWGFMLVSLQWALEHHRGKNRQVAWPRHKVNLSRSEAYARLLRAGSVFEKEASAFLRAGGNYFAKTMTADSYSGRVEFVKELRGFCISVKELNDALFWVTIEGAPGKIEV